MTHIKDLTTSGSISPLRESKYFFRSWSQCSNTNVNFLSECSTSCSRTIFRCFSSFSKHISLNADEGTPWKVLKNQFDKTESCCKQNMLENTPKNIEVIRIELPHRHRLNELFSMQQSLEFLCFLPWKPYHMYLKWNYD